MGRKFIVAFLFSLFIAILVEGQEKKERGQNLGTTADIVEHFAVNWMHTEDQGRSHSRKIVLEEPPAQGVNQTDTSDMEQ